MGSPEVSSKKKKSSVKDWVINKREKKAESIKRENEELKENSASYVIYRGIVDHLFDIISWIIIGVFVYIWWETRGQSTLITPELCQNYLAQYNEYIRLSGLQGKQIVDQINWSNFTFK